MKSADDDADVIRRLVAGDPALACSRAASYLSLATVTLIGSPRFDDRELVVP